VLRNRTPTRYRNRFLAEAMVNLRMIDTMGFGIREVMFRGQARRYLPLPEYDLSSAGHVILRLPGRFLDENYSRVLLSHPDLRWSDVFALDQVQKGLVPASEAIASLRQRKLIEGRKPHLHISASLALATGRKADYIRTRRQADEHYRKLILDYIAQWGGASRQELRTLLWDKLPDGFSDPQRESKIHNLLSAMRRAGAIVNAGTQQRPRWVPGNG
jgi:ATP-dependent DNA helicase RecG